MNLDCHKCLGQGRVSFCGSLVLSLDSANSTPSVCRVVCSEFYLFLQHIIYGNRHQMLPLSLLPWQRQKRFHTFCWRFFVFFSLLLLFIGFEAKNIVHLHGWILKRSGRNHLKSNFCIPYYVLMIPVLKV